MRLIVWIILASFLTLAERGPPLELKKELHVQCNWNHFIGFLKIYLNPQREIYIIYDDLMNLKDELIAAIYKNYNQGIIVSNETNFFKNIPIKRFNIIFLLGNLTVYDPEYGDMRNTRLYFVDSSKMQNITRLDDIFQNSNLFRNIFYIQNLSNCSDYKLWIKFLSNPGKYITNLDKAYFNQKPNYGGRNLLYLNNIWEDNSKEYKYVKYGRARVIRDYLEEKWNFSRSPNAFHGTFVSLVLDTSPLVHTGDAYDVMSLCFILHKGKYNPSWKALLRSYEWSVWCGCAITLISSALGYTVILYFDPQGRSENLLNLFLRSVCKMLSLFITVPINWMNAIQKFQVRILTISIMLSSIILINGFQSCLYSLLQTPGRQPPINSIKQLQSTNIRIHCIYIYYCHMIFDEQNLKYLFLNWDPEERGGRPRLLNHTINDVLMNSNMALIMSCKVARRTFNEISKYSDELHIVEEIISTYPLFIREYMGMGFPFYEKLRRLLANFDENGIGQYEEETYQLSILRKQINENQTEKLKVFSIDDLQIAFIILGIGLSISILIFILENIIFIYNI